MRRSLSPSTPAATPAARSTRAAGGRVVVPPGGRFRGLWRYRWPLLFVSPFFVLFAVFSVYPILFSFWLSLHSWKGVGAMRFVGMDNYVVLMRDSLFWGSMLNAVLLFVIYVPVMTFLSIVLATVLHAGYLRLQGLWRALIFLPHITSMVAAGFTFRLIFEREAGIANHVLGAVGLGPIPWLDDPWWARITVGLLMIWAWLGYNTVIMLAGLQTIPAELGEAARVDGASRLQIFWRITVPLLRPVIIFAVTLSIIGTFQMFTEPFILTGGGPIRATETPMMQIFSNTFSALKFGYAAAMSYVYFAIIVIVTLLQLRMTTRGEE
ncbi:MAG TPA: sugar ABC transporter permease [Chloroflexia bacterium]|nr:sugar ABC transporter permease [Chloroflexia bacterium]